MSNQSTLKPEDRLTQIMRKDKQSFMNYFNQKTVQQTTAICNITGIRIEISAPQIKNNKGQILEYQNPLAIYSNARDFARQGFTQSHAITDNTVLSGCLLTLFHYGRIRRDKLSAAEANFVLSQCKKLNLSQALHFVASLSHFELQRIPQISLTETDPNTLLNWLIDARTKLTAKPDIEEKVIKLAKSDPIDKKLVPSAMRKRAKELIKLLKEQNLIPLSFYSILTLTTHGDNLAVINSELRTKLRNGLDKIDTNEAKELSLIYFKASARSAEVDKELNSGSFAVEVKTKTPQAQLSVSELIAHKLNKTETAIESTVPANADNKQPNNNELNNKQADNKHSLNENKENKEQNNNNESKETKEHSDKEIIALMREIGAEIDSELEEIESEFESDLPQDEVYDSDLETMEDEGDYDVE